MTARVLLSGLGDLGRRLAHGLAGLPEVSEIVLAGRPQGGAELAALVASCGTARVRFAPLDAADPGAVETLLRRERPDLVVQCATLLSPWFLSGRTDPAALALGRAGFALQLPAQLPLVRTLLEAVRAVGLEAPVVNGSYPDLTHPVLARLGLAPTVGIGNAAMIRARVLAALRSARRSPEGRSEPVRLLAHHAQVTPVVLSRPPADPEDRPRVYLGEEGTRDDGLAYAEPPIASERSLNALPAASALPLLRALLPGGPAARLSAPGPQGLPGGWPLRIAEGRLALDLPPGLEREEALALQERWARLDGVAALDADGTVHFTEEARAAVTAVDPGLAEPLRPDDALARLRRLKNVLGAEGAAA